MTVDLTTTALPLPWQEGLYRHLHAHPELSMQETRTLAEITRRLDEMGYRTVQVGGGVVGVLANGEGRCVLTRADFDALPVAEDTGLDYASTVEGVMHACGHDMHVTCALGAAELLAQHRDAWSGTYLALFQPGEETAAGAASMVDDGLVDKIPKPDVCLGQHVMGMPAGQVYIAPGAVMATGDSITVTVFGVGSHGSMPHFGVDPVVLASAIVMRLQTIVSRVIAPGDFGVVTVGSLHAGTKANVIGDRAVLELNVRAYDPKVREKLLATIEQIVRAECAASGSPKEPTFEYHDIFPPTNNDDALTGTVRSALEAALGAENVQTMSPATGSEDFSRIPDAFGVPYCFWTWGGFPEGEPPVANHNPRFAPVIHPTIESGTRALLAASLACLGGAR